MSILLAGVMPVSRMKDFLAMAALRCKSKIFYEPANSQIIKKEISARLYRQEAASEGDGVRDGVSVLIPKILELANIRKHPATYNSNSLHSLI